MTELNMTNLWWVGAMILMPMYLANGAPVVANRIKALKVLGTPLNEKALGSHKTWRGLLAGVLGGWLGAMLVMIVYLITNPQVNWIEFNWFQIIFFSVLGMWLGLGALVGDMLKSFIKRKIKIAPGRPWIPFDQIDFIFGGFLFYLIIPTKIFEGEIVAIIFILALLITPLLHLLANIIAYKLGWKKVWW